MATITNFQDFHDFLQNPEVSREEISAYLDMPDEKIRSAVQFANSCCEDSEFPEGSEGFEKQWLMNWARFLYLPVHMLTESQ